MILWLTQFRIVQHYSLRKCIAPKIDVLGQHPGGFFEGAGRLEILINIILIAL
jgi:hypothetical protein